MNYRHIYHAGNFADIFKHLTLVSIITKMQEKESAITVLDAFAGTGIYDLSSPEAQKTQEYLNGIGNLIEFQSDNTKIGQRQIQDLNNDFITKYLNIVLNLSNAKNGLFYPGSPYIISQILRKQDHLVATELHPQDYASLKYNLRSFNAAVHLQDAYSAIKAFLPPKTSRGLVLLDAPFEVSNEYSKIIESLKIINKRFFAGIVMIWFPIKDPIVIKEFYNDLSSIGYKEYLKIEFTVSGLDKVMNKSGIIIANPPFIKDQLASLMQDLCQKIYAQQASYLLEYI